MTVLQHLIYHKRISRQLFSSLGNCYPNFAVRCLITQCPATVTRISRHLSLYKPIKPADGRGKPQTVALMFPRPHASDSVVKRYSSLYLDRGVSVLCINSNVWQYLWPPAAEQLTEEILAYLATNQTPLSTHQFLVHTMSLGTYMYAVLLKSLFENEPQYSFIKSKIRGQVFDSFIYGGRRNVVNVLPALMSNSLLSGAMRNFAFVHWLFTGQYTENFYDRVANFLELAPIHSPVLFYHSLNDPLCDSEAFDSLIDDWSDKEGIDLHVKCWHQSKHAQHFQEHPREYLKAMQSYLEKVGVPETC